MTTASDIVTASFREANFKALAQAPTALESAEALVLLQALVDSLFGMVVGTKLTPWWVPNPQRTSSQAGNYPAAAGDVGALSETEQTLPPANARLMMKNTSAVRIYFQYQPQDGAIMDYVDVGHTATVTLDANGALFGVAGSDTAVEITSDFTNGIRNARRRWIYRADLGSWVEMTPLLLAEELPFPSWFDDFFICALATRLAPRFGNDPRQVTLLRLRDMNVFIRGQYLQMGITINEQPGGALAEQTYTAGGLW